MATLSLRLSAGALILAATSFWSAPRPLAAQDADREAVVATIQAVFAATERSDYEALDSLYAGDDLTVIEGAGIDRGWVSYRDGHLKPELERVQNFVYRPYEIEAAVHDDLAWAIFRYDLKLEVGDRQVDNVGRGTVVLEKRGGRWVIRHMQTASRPRR
jgi:ketosteroid isomerase-like protein